jgi:hypothetical protein
MAAVWPGLGPENSFASDLVGGVGEMEKGQMSQQLGIVRFYQ